MHGARERGGSSARANCGILSCWRPGTPSVSGGLISTGPAIGTRGMFVRLLFAIALLAAAAAAPAVTSEVAKQDHIRVQLVSEVEHVRPGEPFRVALRMDPAEGWHTYWKNPGDSGLRTRLEWDLPAGFAAGAIDWPSPRRLPYGELVNYGYSGVHGLPVTITPPRDLEPGDTARLRVHADWLACETQCIPGDADFTLALPVRDAPPPKVERHADLFAWADARQPAARDWPARFETEGGRFSLRVDTPDDYRPETLDLFPAAKELVQHATPASFAFTEGRVLASQPLSDFFNGAPETLEVVLVDPRSDRAVSVTATRGELGAAAPPVSGNGISGGDIDARGGTAVAAGGSGPGIALALALALGGGLLLNLMPCVFPVLSLKAINVLEGGERPRAHGAAYTSGVLVAFAAVAGTLLGLRAGGEAIGWGFQLQSPWFVGLLAYLLFAMGLWLSGLVQLGTSWMGLGSDLAARGGLPGSFFTGVLACVVASPCTAPFMGAALGFAVTQPAPVALAVFLALGLGLALPILLLGFIPGLARLLPRPGPWMETFKQAMAFPLYLTVVWLLWVLARQTGADALAGVLAGLVAVAFAFWLASRATRPGWTTAARRAVVAASLAAAVATLGWAGTASRTGPASEPGQRAWEPWTPERLADLRESGRPVFVNMTADWCVTCLVNERVALESERVREIMARKDIVYLKGDWTRRDPAITRYLSRFDRNGGPLYVFYPAGKETEPRVLPQILTPDLLADAMQERADS
jgi:thiol:disulfide interchange protein DsbD